MRSSTSVRRLATQNWSPLPFLCPALANPASARAWRTRAPQSPTRSHPQRCLHIETAKTPFDKRDLTASFTSNKLPLNCPGCGAYSQTQDPSQPGHYATARRPVKAFITAREKLESQEEEGRVFDEATAGLSKDDKDALGVAGQVQTEVPVQKSAPLCDRCHELLHHNKGVSIYHPNMSSLQDVIAETPHRYNHIYHVLDAADFPMSLIPGIHDHLDLTPQRSRNRRAKSHKFRSGRSAELSFIITRSDLLAPKKEQVDHMMPVLTEILREALGRDARDVRLGNVRCVSSKRGWWTKQVKDDIWKRGGGQWMVGKVNVGKSNLFETVFPKGRAEEISIKQLRREAARADRERQSLEAEKSTQQPRQPNQEELRELVSHLGEDEMAIETHARGEAKEGYKGDANMASEKEEEPTISSTQELESLVLPPAAPETPFPTMPTVSQLPGTTAQPIRLRFGNGKGELIDLPGLDRRDLTDYVKEDQQQNLVMRSREKPAQQTIKPGQSLLIGDLIRITPASHTDSMFLVSSFVPLETHITNTQKAVAIQRQEDTSPAVAQYLKPGLGEKIQSAGWFELKWDVTKARAGPLTRNDAAGLKPSILPFIVYSADILIEGVGWVEVAVQLRRKQIEDDPSPPMVEVFSPFGKHIAMRQPLGAFMVGGHMKKPVSRRSQRPRKSMKGVKKAEKKARRIPVAA